mmetsp:Transcript_8532/g.22795  ORF Transcript_8532/g.22795 Transcript_8532/m.22795 type:complete len:205 (+) Transcript_8532:601-1215(+)
MTGASHGHIRRADHTANQHHSRRDVEPGWARQRQRQIRHRTCGDEGERRPDCRKCHEERAMRHLRSIGDRAGQCDRRTHQSWVAKVALPTRHLRPFDNAAKPNHKVLHRHGPLRRILESHRTNSGRRTTLTWRWHRGALVVIDATLHAGQVEERRRFRGRVVEGGDRVRLFPAEEHLAEVHRVHETEQRRLPKLHLSVHRDGKH